MVRERREESFGGCGNAREGREGTFGRMLDRAGALSESSGRPQESFGGCGGPLERAGALWRASAGSDQAEVGFLGAPSGVGASGVGASGVASGAAASGVVAAPRPREGATNGA